jgi:hypothetical protein
MLLLPSTGLLSEDGTSSSLFLYCVFQVNTLASFLIILTWRVSACWGSFILITWRDILMRSGERVDIFRVEDASDPGRNFVMDNCFEVFAEYVDAELLRNSLVNKRVLTKIEVTYDYVIRHEFKLLGLNALRAQPCTVNECTIRWLYVLDEDLEIRAHEQREQLESRDLAHLSTLLPHLGVPSVEGSRIKVPIAHTGDSFRVGLSTNRNTSARGPEDDLFWSKGIVKRIEM